MTRFVRPVSPARLLIVGAVLVAAAAACSTGSGGTRSAGSGQTATGQEQPAVASRTVHSPAARNVAGIVSDLRAAAVRHDATAEVTYRNELASRLGADALGSVEATYHIALADLQTAMIRHDAQGIAGARARFETLCATGSLTRQLEDCDADLATVMR
jgi:hypothetical protein